MKKRMKGIVLGIIIILGVIITVTTKQKTIYTEIDGIKYAILVDGVSASTFPNGNYKSNIECTNAKGYWDAIERKVMVYDITGYITCTVSFTSITNNDYLNNYIISLENTTQGDGTVIHETVDSFTTIDNQTTTEAGYRYEGKNPNNYVWFNNELWRIIGVFGPESHGQSGKQLVKIIKNNVIGGLVWDKNQPINWNTSILKALLNGAYYNHTTDTENCYGDPVVPTTCDYTKEGIQSGYQGMIENVKWYLGGGGASGYQTYTAPMEYQYERRGIAYSGQPTTGEGKIGLMYVSDYLYGKKSGNNWLFKGNIEWTISPFSYDWYRVFYVDTYGTASSSSATSGHGARPVLYLSSSVYKISGTGTQVDPYIIGM